MPFVLRTVMIYTIGIEYIGLNSVFSSIILILSFAELGIGGVMVYAMYKPIAEKNDEKLCELLNYYKSLYRLIGIIVLFFGIGILPFLNLFINGTYPADINLYILYIIFLFNSVISYWLFTYKSSLLQAHQMYYVCNNVSTVIMLFQYMVQFVILLVFKNYYLYILMMPLSTIANNFYVSYKTDKIFPNIRAKGTLDKETRDSIRKNVLSGIGHKLGPTATTSIDNLVISGTLGLTAAAVYSNYNYIVTTVTGFVSLFFGSYVAAIGKKLVTNCVDENYKEFRYFTFLNCLLVGWSSICILCLCQPFMWLWVGKNNANYMYTMPLVVALVFMYYVQQIRAVVTTYKSAAGMWYADRLKPYVAAGLNAVLDIVLIKYLGLMGIILSTIFARAAIGIPWETHALFKVYFKKSKKDYYLDLLKYAFNTFIIGIISYSILKIIPDGTLLLLIVKGICCICLVSFLYVAFYFRNPYMKLMTYNILTPILKKIKRRK